MRLVRIENCCSVITILDMTAKNTNNMALRYIVWVADCSGRRRSRAGRECEGSKVGRPTGLGGRLSSVPKPL